MVAALAEAPGPKGFWPVGHVVQFRRDPLALLTRVAREYGDVARCKAGPQSLYLINHPDYIRDVLARGQARVQTPQPPPGAQVLLVVARAQRAWVLDGELQ